MYIDESLAKGLTSRLWNELEQIEMRIDKYMNTYHG